MNAIEKAKLIDSLTGDLLESVSDFEQEKDRNGGSKPAMGDGSVWQNDAYGIPKQVIPGLKQGATATAIERKIITIREQLNDLRKLVCK